jgi:nucleotide-binding universal stress UspA family protein
MVERNVPSSSVVIGIDGSRNAVRAALWGVDEAVSRDVPLRLICAIAPDDAMQHDPQSKARKLAAAELAIRYAVTAVESTEQLVKFEAEIIPGPPIRTLVDASRSATMLCVGEVGITLRAAGRVGSTAASLASSAHCPVAIIRARDYPPADRGAILAYVSTSADHRPVLEAAFEEARLRGMRLLAVTAWQSRFGDVHDSGFGAEGKRQVHAELERQLECWVHRYPDLEVSSEVVYGRLLDHLTENVDSVRLVVIGTQDCDATRFGGHAAHAVLQSAGCSVLIVSSAQL